ncbi:hypothetical protein FE257_010513 [Aspergillus nanangensis]|uniref:Polynucleotide adenylyltransferase n=1 Tax=Aspergillus nanangensis TaxID=2582783 RepID=A0AAD4CJ27_ASPNN|nr:hypothetical protein FE257_010513 [Aspergillus nanangensis]
MLHTVAVSTTQCISCHIERAAMRPAFVNRPVFSLSPLQIYHSLLATRPLVRGLHGSASLHRKEPIIFNNSLEKTLEAHRASNRAGLIRKVISKDVSEEIRSPDTVLDNPSTEPSSCAQSPLFAKKRTTPKKKHRVLKSDTTPSVSTNSPYSQIDWKVNVSEGRPQQFPWLELLEQNVQISDGISQLDAEIRALQTYMTPTSVEQYAVNQVVAEISSLLGHVVPQPPIVVGSRRTDFAMSHSDLDFVFPIADEARSVDLVRRPSPSRPQVLELYGEILRKVKPLFDQSPSFSTRLHMSGKRNPAFSVIHLPTDLEVQLYCGEQLPASVEYIQDYHAEYPAIRPLYMVTRLILETQGVYGSHKSSIGSDALLMLLVAFLKMNHGRFRQSNNLGVQLLDLLRLYGTEVDLTTTGVSVDPPCFFNANSTKEATRNHDPLDIPAYLRGQRSLINLKRTAISKRNVPTAEKLCVQDPANYMNDLGRGCTRTREVQVTFARAYEHLQASLSAWEDPKSAGLSPSILSQIVTANFDDFNQIRGRIARYRG